SATKKLQADCDCKDTNIVLQALPPDVYAIVNHHKVAIEIWDRVNLLMQGTKLSLQEKECKLYDEFDKFSFVKGSLQPTINFDLSLIRETRPPFNMAGLLCNKFKGGKDKVILVLDIRPKRPRNIAWFKEKAMLAEAQEAGQILDEEQLAFLVDLGIPDSQVAQTTILNTDAFQTEHLDAYDSDCDDVSNAKAVLMANPSNYGLDVISKEKKVSEPPCSKTLFASSIRLETYQGVCLKNEGRIYEQVDMAPRYPTIVLQDPSSHDYSTHIPRRSQFLGYQSKRILVNFKDVDQYVVLSGKVDMSYPTGGYGVFVDMSEQNT
ncbi:hypothetical protein Tco_0897505, partial [Tanacetum coccineum]